MKQEYYQYKITVKGKTVYMFGTNEKMNPIDFIVTREDMVLDI